MHYYETEHKDGGVISFDDLDEAITYANANGSAIISEIGGNWCEFEKCTFCGEWFDSCELNTRGECDRCEMAIKDHGGN